MRLTHKKRADQQNPRPLLHHNLHQHRCRNRRCQGQWLADHLTCSVNTLDKTVGLASALATTHIFRLKVFIDSAVAIFVGAITDPVGASGGPASHVSITTLVDSSSAQREHIGPRHRLYQRDKRLIRDTIAIIINTIVIIVRLRLSG